MKISAKFSIAVILLTLAIFPLRQALALASTNDLGLSGASIRGLAQGNGLVFAVARGPRGIYISDDFGDSWTFAAGGSYSVGSGQAVVTTSSKVFAILGPKLFVSTLSASPNWSEVDLDLSSAGEEAPTVNEKPLSLATDGTFVFVGTNYGRMKSIRVSTLEILQSGLVGAGGVASVNARVTRIAVDSSDGRLMLLSGGIGKLNGRILSATYNLSTGLVGTLGDRTPPPLKLGTGRMGGVFADGNGTYYVSTFNEDSSESGVYRSTDGGSNWGKRVSSGALDKSLDIVSASFNGSVHLVGRFLSTDSGNTFTELPAPSTSSGSTVDGAAVLVNESDSDQALATAAVGTLGTDNLSEGSDSDWAEKLSGLRGLLVSDIDQSPSNDNVVVMGISIGLARSTNFLSSSRTFQYPIIPNIAGQKAIEPIFAVTFDPDDANIVYAGGSRLYRVNFNTNPPTWSALSSEITEGRFVKDISVSGDSIVAAFSQTALAVGGAVMVFDRSDLNLKATALSGKPVTSVVAVSEKVIYAALGGDASDESDASQEANLGLYRSLDGGETFDKIESNSTLNTSSLPSLAYDSLKKILYVAANSAGLEDANDFASSGEDSSDSTANLFIVRDLSKKKVSISKAKLGLPSSGQISRVVVALKDSSSKVFAALGSSLYVSNSEGESWALLDDGLSNEQIRALFFDDLVKGSTSGFESVSGNPNLIVSKVKSSAKSGTRKAITISLSKEFQNSTTNIRRISAKASDLKLRVRKKNTLALSVQPTSTNWRKGLKVRLRVKSGFTSADNELLDSDYDGTVDGNTYSKTINVKD